MAADGAILSMSSNTSIDVTLGTYYAPPDDYRLPDHCKFTAIARDGLVEVKRLGPLVDLVVPHSAPSERLAFKHYEDDRAMTDVWYSVQIMAGMAGYTHLVPLRHLVLDEHSGGVVGFTMPFVPGGSLEATRTTRIFKLKWAKQLFQALDCLALEHGISHRDIRLRNLMVDPATDNLVLIDFGKARRYGHTGGTCVPPTAYSPEQRAFHQSSFFAALGMVDAQAGEEEKGREDKEFDIRADPDVNGTIVIVHDFVTRNPVDSAWMTDECGLWNGWGIDPITAGPWTAHPDAQLDSPAEAYRTALTDWLRQRRTEPRCRAPATPLGFSDHMPIPRGDSEHVRDYVDPLYPDPTGPPPPGIAQSVRVSGYRFLRRDTVRFGRSVVDWTRPVKTNLDPARTLLATGRYADEGEEYYVGKYLLRKRKKG